LEIGCQLPTFATVQNKQNFSPPKVESALPSKASTLNALGLFCFLVVLKNTRVRVIAGNLRLLLLAQRNSFPHLLKKSGDKQQYVISPRLFLCFLFGHV
jgi:hypothetical protein